MQLSSINGFSTLRNNEQGVFFQIPHGIPDPSQECSKECLLGPDQRRRVRREGGASSLCVYIASAVIRRTIGPTFCEQLKPLQHFETALITMQQAQAKHETTLYICNQVLGSDTKEGLLKCDKARAEHRVHNMEGFLHSEPFRAQIRAQVEKCGKPFDLATTLKDTPGQIALHRDFLAQDKFQNLFDYCLDLKIAPRFKIQLAFLAALGKNREQIKADLKSFCGPKLDCELSAADKLASLPFRKFASPLQSAVQMLALHHFDLDFAYWKPSEPFSVLLALMKTHGPLCIGGALGECSYLSEPKRLEEKWGDREVYAWLPGSPKRNIEIITHAVTIIGALSGPENAGNGYVYFLDPVNPSDPSDPTLDKIYKISYKNLQANALPLSYQFSEGSDEGHATGFAWKRKRLAGETSQNCRTTNRCSSTS